MRTPSELICILARVGYWYGLNAQVHHIDESGGVFLMGKDGKIEAALERPLPAGPQAIKTDD